MRHIHSRSRFTLAMIGLTATGSLMLSASVQGQLLDDFNDGDDVGWTHFTHHHDPGDPPPMWDVDPDPNDPNNFVYRLWVDGWAPWGTIVGSALDITADPSYSNGYWWATVVRETEESECDLAMRLDWETISGYVFNWAPFVNRGALAIARYDDGDPTQLAELRDFWPDFGQEYIIEAGAIGSHLELRMWPLGDPRPEQPQVEAWDCTYPSGVNCVVAHTAHGGILSSTFDDVSFLPVEPIAGDIDTDGDVDLADLATLLAAYGTCAGDPTYNAGADLDCSDCVDLTDLAELLARYGEGV